MEFLHGQDLKLIKKYISINIQLGSIDKTLYRKLLITFIEISFMCQVTSSYTCKNKCPICGKDYVYIAVHIVADFFGILIQTHGTPFSESI